EWGGASRTPHRRRSAPGAARPTKRAAGTPLPPRRARGTPLPPEKDRGWTAAPTRRWSGALQAADGRAPRRARRCRRELHAIAAELLRHVQRALRAREQLVDRFTDPMLRDADRHGDRRVLERLARDREP